MQVEPAICAACGAAFNPLRSRAVWVSAGRVRAFCSQACKQRAQTGAVEPQSLSESAPAEEPVARRSRRRPLFAVGGALVVVAGGALAASLLHKGAPPPLAAVAPSLAHAAVPPAPPPKLEDALAILAAPSAVEKPATGAKSTKVAASEESDVWIHPLLGPARHMPLRNTRRFGAARGGMRPEECGDGHCGVDIGVEKGATVLAAHDGVVERVERDPELGGRRGNEGRFIRVNHKGGTVVTSYIHLDGIRADLRPGVPVKAGEPLGTVGDTGVHASGPHLHFAVSVKATPDGQELWIDPEPLLHLWPVRAKATPIKGAVAMEPPPKPHPRTAKLSAPVAEPSPEAE